jgi:hypothetical protein
MSLLAGSNETDAESANLHAPLSANRPGKAHMLHRTAGSRQGYRVGSCNAEARPCFALSPSFNPSVSLVTMTKLADC